MTDKAEDLKFVNETPILQSLLYDLGLLPEQCTSEEMRARFSIIVRHFKWFTERPQEALDVESLKRELAGVLDEKHKIDYSDPPKNLEWLQVRSMQTTIDHLIANYDITEKRK